jgi:hypothetical protein
MDDCHPGLTGVQNAAYRLAWDIDSFRFWIFDLGKELPAAIENPKSQIQNQMIRVLFVCLGNICRSPMAEAVFQHLVNEAGLVAQIVVDSAGTGDWHVGEPAHTGTRRVLTQRGIAYNGRARQVGAREVT